MLPVVYYTAKPGLAGASGNCWTSCERAQVFYRHRLPAKCSARGAIHPRRLLRLSSADLLDAETRRRFAYLGLFVPKPATFDLEAMAIAWDVNDPKPIARALVNRGLLEPVSGGRFQMHALLVLHAQSLFAAEVGSGL